MNKGFAISGMIYSILILFLLILFGLLSVMGARKMILDKLKNDVITELNYDITQNGESLISLLLKQYSPNNTKGLVKDSTNENLYYYTGTKEEVTNNFLWYGGHQWRILDFDTSSKTLTLITQQPLTSIASAKTVWTTKEEYESSYINNWLNDYFWNSLDSSIKANILNTTFNIGIYTDVDEITTIQKVGLLDKNQYEKSGGTNSFLDIKDAFWLGNRYNSSNISDVGSSGVITNFSSLSAIGVRVVIKISDLTINEGNGTLSNSYRLSNKATNTNNIQVGEYINVPYSGNDNACGSDNMCIFRVVSKNSDSIKVVLNGLLSTTSAWADNASDNITTNDLIYKNVLNVFIANIESKYIKEGTYGVENYISGQNYIVPQNTTISTNIGLPTVGEMFSGNDIDLTTSSGKTSVDVNTIENPNISGYYWTMNRHSSTNIRGVFSSGYLGAYNPSNAYGVRPTIYLKNNLSFSGGNGTAQNPYTLR